MKRRLRGLSSYTPRGAWRPWPPALLKRCMVRREEPLCGGGPGPGAWSAFGALRALCKGLVVVLRPDMGMATWPAPAQSIRLEPSKPLHERSL